MDRKNSQPDQIERMQIEFFFFSISGAVGKAARYLVDCAKEASESPSCLESGRLLELRRIKKARTSRRGIVGESVEEESLFRR